MLGLVLGIDLCDDYSQVSCMNTTTKTPEAITLSSDEASCLIPTMICKKKGEDTWFIGEEAYRQALFGQGTMVDKLVKLCRKDGYATIEGTRYSAEELLRRYVEMLLGLAREKYQLQAVTSLVFTVQTLEGKLLDLLVRLAEGCGIARSDVRILSHTETFVYYVVNQRSDVWSNLTCMYDLTDDGLHYYEMKMIRGRKPLIVKAGCEHLEESFRPELLERDNGPMLADTILTACAKRLVDKKVISSIFLTGKGFVKTDWAPNFLDVICTKRKVFAGQHVFASGAAYVAYDSLLEKTAYPFVCLCEGRIRANVTAEVQYEGRTEKLVLAEAGTNWYEAQTRVELIPDQCDVLELTIAPVDIPRSDRVKIDLSDFPERPNKTTRLEVILSFVSEDCMTVRVIDQGFGEIFPSSGRMIKKDFYLS